MLGEKIELTDHVDSIYDFILDVDYKYQEIIMSLYKKGELEDEIQLLGDYENKKIFKNQMKRGIYQLFSKALDILHFLPFSEKFLDPERQTAFPGFHCLIDAPHLEITFHRLLPPTIPWLLHKLQ